jgi:hypothetical protein
VINIAASVVKTVPAELVLAYDALHMITAFVLFNFSSTDRAKLDPAFLFSPTFKLVLHSLVTALSLVIVIPAHEANAGIAFRTSYLLVIQGQSFCNTLAARPRAPPH